MNVVNPLLSCGSFHVLPVAHLEVTEFKSVDEDEIFVLFGMKALQNARCVDEQQKIPLLLGGL